MAKYKYYCDICLDTFDVFHSIKEEITQCIKCESIKIHKVYGSTLNISNDNPVKVDIGQITQEYIEENKQVLRQLEKERMEYD